MIIVFRFAILFTVIVEIVPAETRAFCVGVFLFMMNMLVSSDESGYFTADEREIIKNTYKVRINIDTFHTSSKTKSGFKADLFVKKVVSY